MLGSKPSIPLTTMSLVTAFLHAAFGGHPLVALWHECFNELEYPSKGGFDVNLRELMRSFIDLALIVGHARKGRRSVIVYGMAQCWREIELRL